MLDRRLLEESVGFRVYLASLEKDKAISYGEVERPREVMVVSCFKILSWSLPSGTVEIHR